MKQRHQQKLVIITMVLLIGLNLPILLLFDSAEAVMGFPVIYIYIFSVWLFSILLSFIIIKRYHE
ncbi:hypothetical protein WMW71_12470 [Flavobacterium buctense]|uniref:DUF3311 domain-containing protein n=1 Tax=Flavobacterium buctense TaxID=1648146 RepID=A0ABU9E3W1_9FLAO|nr:hypothetical protein [Flavobacterium buctense]